MKKLSILILLFFCVQLSAQDLWTKDNKTCFTMEQYAPEDFEDMKSVPNLLVPGGTFGVNVGYGAGCANDCDLAPRMPVAGCNSPEYYTLPVVFRVNSATCGGTGPSTQAEIDAMLASTNAYYACVGLPIRVAKCTTYDTSVLQPGAAVGADGSTVTEAYNCPYDGNDVTDIPNVMNVYIADDTGNGTGCNGFAFLPFGTAPEVNVMSNACFSGYTDNVDCGNLAGSLGSSTVFIHEIGHYLGLLHTHDTGGVYGGGSDDPNSGADDCTTGDFIVDTDEDPDYSAGEIAALGCNTGGPFPDCSFGNMADPACSPYGMPNTIDNIMSYNLFQGCTSAFTDCQKAKMIDALTCFRNNSVCCDPAVTDNPNAADYMTETIQYVCAGDVPTDFTIDNPAGGAPALDANCIAWYDAMGNVLGNGATFTPPTSGTGAFDNNTPGTYVYFFDDDANEYTVTDCDDQVLKQVTIIVLGDAGAGDSGGASTTITDCAAATDIPIDALNAALGSDANAIGWYFSTTDPTTTLTTSAAITGAISGAPTGNPAAPADGDIFQSDTNDPETALSALTVDCAALGDGTYYMTPFIAYGQAPVLCTQTSPTSSGADYGDPFGGAGILFDAVGPLSCDGMGLPNKTWEICVDITSAGTDMIVFSVNDPAASCGAIGFPGPTANCPTFPCQFCFQQSDFPAGFDPEVDDYCLAAADGNLGNAQGDIVYTATTTITYTGDDAYTIWDANGTPDIQADNGAESCFWGAPYAVTCNCSSVCMIENVTSTDAVCNGNNAEYEICFDVTDGSGDYNIVDADAGNAILFNQAGLPTDTDPMLGGDEVCITVTITGPTTATVLNVDVVDNTDAACIGGMPVGVAVPDCPGTTAMCTAVAGEPLASAPATICGGPGAPLVNLADLFDPGMGGYDDGAGNFDPVVTNYVAVDAAGNIVSVADSDAMIDLSTVPDGQQVCIRQLVYTQALLDDITAWIDANICGIPGASGIITACPFGMVELAPILDGLNTAFGPLSDQFVCDFLDNQVINLGNDPLCVFGVCPIEDALELLGADVNDNDIIEIDLAAVNLDLCAAKSSQYCVMVEAASCTVACDAAAPVVSNDGGDCPADADGSGDNTPFVFSEDGTGNMNAPYITEYIVTDGASGTIIGVFPTLAAAQAAANTEALAPTDADGDTAMDACIQAINHDSDNFEALVNDLDGQVFGGGILCGIVGCPVSTLEALYTAVQGLGASLTVADVVSLVGAPNAGNPGFDIGSLLGLGVLLVDVPPFCYELGNEDCITVAPCSVACPAITAVDAPANGCSSATAQTICVTYDQDPTGLVTTDINGIMGTITGNQICYDIPMENTGCDATSLDIIHNATCVDDGSDILLTDGTNTNGLNLGPVMVFPVYQVTNPTDDTGTCGAFTVNLMSSNTDGTPNTMCQTATLNCMADGDILTIDYTAAVDADTNPITTQITDTDILGCSGTLSASSTACAMCPTTCDPTIATSTAPPVVIVSESMCPDGMNLGGGMLGAAMGCPTGSMVQYSVDGGPFSTSVPMYNQTTSETITTQCVCTADPIVVSMTNDVVTTPGVCVPICEIQAMIVGTPACDNGGDDDPTNDMLTFTVAISDNGNGSAAGWTDDQAVPQTGTYGGTATYTLVANSSVTITYTDVNDPDCGMTSVTLIATDCATEEVVPTVGEWGLIILGLLMSITAIVGIRQRQMTIAYEEIER